VFALALEQGGVSLVNLFVATAPGFIAVGAYVWFRERVGRGTIMLVTGAVVGLGLASWGSGTGVHVTVLSIGLGAATTATVVAYTLGTKALLDRYSPAAVSALVMVIGALALLPTGPALPPSAGSWVGVLALGVGATYAAHLLYLRGLEVLGTTTTGLLVSLEAPVALGLAAVLVGERFTPLGLVGVALVLASSLLVIVRPGRRAERALTAPALAAVVPDGRGDRGGHRPSAQLAGRLEPAEARFASDHQR
jgi:drug/metabolite transporter (DMT)-like permease